MIEDMAMVLIYNLAGMGVVQFLLVALCHIVSREQTIKRSLGMLCMLWR